MHARDSCVHGSSSLSGKDTTRIKMYYVHEYDVNRED